MAVEQTIEGVNANPFRIIQGTLKMGPDAISVANTSASNDLVAQVVGPNKIVMDTGYFPPNTFLGPVKTDIVFYSNVTGSNVLTLEVWRKSPTGYEEIISTSSQQYYADISPYFGNSTGLQQYYTNNNQYRYVLKSASGNAASTTVGIDFLKIITLPVFQVSPRRQYSGTGEYYGSPTTFTFDCDHNLCASIGTAGFTWNVTTGYDCTEANIAVTAESTGGGATMPLIIITARTTTGFSVYMQPAGGGNFANNVTLMYVVGIHSDTTKI